MKRLLLTALLLAPLVVAQEQVQKVVPLKYADPQSLVRLLSPFGVNMQYDNRMRVITISGNKDRVSVAEDAIKQLDVPSAAQKDIELTAYFVTGSNNAALNAGNPIPQELQSTVSSLKSTFPFSSYLLLDVLSLRTRSGMGGETSGQLGGNRISVFRVRAASVTADGQTIQLDSLHAGVRFGNRDKDGKLDYTDTGLTADVLDIKDGQKLVVGRSSLQGPEQALFLILIAHVAN
jgi:hypothetical protein